jgi:phenylacetate-coenzyme A ligase PaaK-like adenylate-forming protein
MGERLPSLIWDAWRTKRGGREPIASRQRERLAEMVTFARQNSPYYRELYRDVPAHVDDPALLPVTDKKRLMACFDEWVTDREVTIENVRAFVDNPDLIGERFLGRHIVATTSGTTGTPGIFLLDDRSLTVTNAMLLRWLRAWLGFGDLIKFLAGGRRMAMTFAPGHTATGVAAARLRKSASGRKRVLALSVHTPLPEMVARLNEFRPALFGPYASVGKLLAGEQEAGRLNIRPVLMALAAEGLPISEYDRIAKVFGTKVSSSYAATECMHLSYDCAHRWLHVNSDWAVLEPVDADYRPVPPGEQSHTVLLSNLANRVQPVLRYDLGDSVEMRSDPCPCGNPLPAIRVRGRSADVLSFPTEGGGQVSIPPLALEVDQIPGLELSQIVQTTPTNLRVRLRARGDADPDRVWEAVQSELTRLLAKHQLDRVTVERAEEPPEQSAGGKYRTVIPHGEGRHANG